MELQIKSRKAGKSGEIKQIRREGGIPAIVYSQGKPGETIIVDSVEFQKILNRVEPGTLSTKVFMLNLDGKKRKAILKDIQYFITTYAVQHLDFEELHDDVQVNVNIPIRMTGVAECAGAKLGGVLRQIIRALRVRCYPKDMPTHLEIDVKDLAVGHSKKLEDLVLPPNVRPLMDLKEVLIAVSKR